MPCFLRIAISIRELRLEAHELSDDDGCRDTSNRPVPGERF